MGNQLNPIAKFNPKFNKELPFQFTDDYIYASDGLKTHISKRHPECLNYISSIPTIISSPDYIGVNPNEANPSFELVKIMSDNVQIGIKLDIQNGYLYVATLHTITPGKLQHRIKNGRLKKII